MGFEITIKKHVLQFKFPAGTSRGVLTEKPTWLVFIKDLKTGNVGVGEAAPLEGLSMENIAGFETSAQAFVSELVRNGYSLEHLEAGLASDKLEKLPSLRFGLETAVCDLMNGGSRIIFNNAFSQGKAKIPINGLIWMGKKDFMLQQIAEKLTQGYKCLKMKIGAIDFETELDILKSIRSQFGKDQLVLRVDANGAFSVQDAYIKLETLSKFHIHSIEQPIAAGQPEEMKTLCQNTPVDIALDEELISLVSFEQRKDLLERIKPQYIILKPTLLGGVKACDEWIQLTQNLNIGWWVTSALESNVGLNAICQYTYEKEAVGHQGLGTGQLYHNNIDSPLTVDEGFIFLEKKKKWQEVSW